MPRYYLFFVIFISLFLYFYGCDTVVSSQSKPDVPTDHSQNISGFLHPDGARSADGCTECHGKDLHGGVRNLNGRYIWAQSCYQCHGKLWDIERQK